MDINKLVEVLRATLQPDQREEAEKHLAEVNRRIYAVTVCLKHGTTGDIWKLRFLSVCGYSRFYIVVFKRVQEVPVSSVAQAPDDVLGTCPTRR